MEGVSELAKQAMTAIDEGDQAQLQQCLAAGLDPLACSGRHLRLPDVAAMCGNRAALELLLSVGGDDDPAAVGSAAHSAMLAERLDLALALVDRYGTELANSRGGTLLHSAATLHAMLRKDKPRSAKRYLRFVKRLLAGGADPNAKPPGMSSALSLAQHLGDAQIARLLERAGARPQPGDCASRG